MDASLPQVAVVRKSPEVSFVVLTDGEYAEVDQQYGLVTLWHGQVDADGSRTYGRPVASMPLAFLVAIAGAVATDGQVAA